MSQDTILLLISAATGLLGMPVIQWLKSKVGVADKWALLIATAVSFVIAGLVSWLGGTLVLDQPITVDMIGQNWAAVFSVATVFYKALLGDKTS